MSHLIDLDVAFYMHLIPQFDSARVKCDVKTDPKAGVTLETSLLKCLKIARTILSQNLSETIEMLSFEVAL